MSRRSLASAPVADIPGMFRVSWSANFEAASYEAAAAMARAALLRRGPADFDVERHADKAQGVLLFGTGARRIKADAPAAAARGSAPARIEPGPRVQPGLVFVEAYRVARRAAWAEHGAAWRNMPGARVVGTLQGAARSYKTERGTVIRFPADYGFPAARYWQAGAFPAALVVQDYARSAATERESRRAIWSDWIIRAQALKQNSQTARAGWTLAFRNLVESSWRGGDRGPFYGRGATNRAEMQSLARSFWVCRRLLREHMKAKPAKPRKADMMIQACEVLCPHGAATEAYKAWLAAWEASPSRHAKTEADRFAAWISSLPKGDSFRYDAAERAALYGERIADKFKQRDNRLKDARAYLQPDQMARGAAWAKDRASDAVKEAWARHREARVLQAVASAEVVI